MTLTGRQFRIAAGPQVATVAEVGAGLREYFVDGVPITCGYDAVVLPPKACGTTLVPWPNRIRGGQYTFEGVAQQLALTEPERGNAIHGLGRWERWAKLRGGPDFITLRLDVVPQKGYPFPLRVDVTYSVHAERGLMVTIAARNTGPTRAPFGAGSHPYLATYGHRLQDVTLQLPAREALVVDERQLPVGTRALSGRDDFRRGRRLRETRFDDGFTGLSYTDGRGAAELRTKSGSTRIWFDATFEFLQVFTVDDLFGGVPGIAIEPMTCAPDAFNSGSGLIVLEPGGAWAGSWGLQPF